MYSKSLGSRATSFFVAYPLVTAEEVVSKLSMCLYSEKSNNTKYNLMNIYKSFKSLGSQRRC